MYTEVYRHGKPISLALAHRRAKVPLRSKEGRFAPYFDQGLGGRPVYIPQTPGSASSPKGCKQERPTRHEQANQE